MKTLKRTIRKLFGKARNSRTLAKEKSTLTLDKIAMEIDIISLVVDARNEVASIARNKTLTKAEKKEKVWTIKQRIDYLAEVQKKLNNII